MERGLGMTTRRGLMLSSWSLGAALLTACARGESGEPWAASELMKPAELARILRAGKALPHIYCVAFPVLYRQRHIEHSVFAGPTAKPEGIQALRAAVSSLAKSVPVVIYCGCCPMNHCPNIRPAYRTLKELGFKNVRVLDIPTNLHQDWVAKDYPAD